MAGRPTKLNDEIMQKAREYLDGGYEAAEHMIPSKVGLAEYLQVSTSSIDNWGESSEEFLGIIKEVMAKQHRVLLSKGLSSDFNPTITKLILTKHGYSDKVDNNNVNRNYEINVTRKVVDAD